MGVLCVPDKSPTLGVNPQHVWIQLLEWELGEQGDQILLTEQ